MPNILETDNLEFQLDLPPWGRGIGERVADGVVGFLLGVAFMLVVIQIWGLSWVRFLAPSWKPGA